MGIVGGVAVAVDKSVDRSVTILCICRRASPCQKVYDTDMTNTVGFRPSVVRRKPRHSLSKKRRSMQRNFNPPRPEKPMLMHNWATTKTIHLRDAEALRMVALTMQMYTRLFDPV